MCLLRKFKSFFLLCIVCLSARITACLITIVNLINEVWTRAFVFLTTLIKRTGVNSIILRVKHGRVAGIHNLLIYLFIYLFWEHLFIYLFIYLFWEHMYMVIIECAGWTSILYLSWKKNWPVNYKYMCMVAKVSLYILKQHIACSASLLSQIYLKIVCPNKCMR